MKKFLSLILALYLIISVLVTPVSVLNVFAAEEEQIPGDYNWSTLRQPTYTQNFMSITYGNGRYVAVGASGTVAYSDDGDTWTYVEKPTNLNLNSVTYGNGLFIAVGNAATDESGVILSSTDGVTWDIRTPNPEQQLVIGQNLFCVAWGGQSGNEKFIVVGNNGATLQSSDGINWASGSKKMSSGDFPTTALRGVAWNDTAGRFVVIGQDGNINKNKVFKGKIITSSDGITWTLADGAVSQNVYRAVRWIGDKFMLVGSVYSGDDKKPRYEKFEIQKSPNTTGEGTWALCDADSNPNCFSLYDLAYAKMEVEEEVEGEVKKVNKDVVVAVGDSGTILKSTNGGKFTLVSSETGNNINGVIWANNKFTVVGNGGVILTSTDGGTWNHASSSSGFLLNTNITGIAWNGKDTYAAVAGSSDKALVWKGNKDASKWESTTPKIDDKEIDKTLNEVIWTGDKFIVVGNQEIILSSTDARTWEKTNNEVAEGSDLSDIAWNGKSGKDSVIVAVGGIANTEGVIFYFKEGEDGKETWTKVTRGNQKLFSVSWIDNKFYAVGQGGVIYSSADGVNWTLVLENSETETHQFYSIAANDQNIVVACGNVSTIRTSVDGGQTFSSVTKTGLDDTSSNRHLRRVLWDGYQFNIFGGQGTVLTSIDGMNWYKNDFSEPTSLRDVLWNNLEGKYVLVSDGGGIFEGTANVSIESISLKGIEKVSKGMTKQLSVNLQPANAAKKLITWSSDNTEVATVDELGFVTGISSGTVVITATAGADIKASCNVTVCEVTKVTLDVAELSLMAGEIGQLVSSVEPETAANKAVTWTSSDDNVASVDSEGLVTAKAPGTAIIRATSADNTDIFAECTVNVLAAATASKIEISGPTTGMIPENGKQDLNLTYSAEIKDQYDTVMPNETILWSIQPKKTGISINDQGVVTVNDDAKAGSYEIKAVSVSKPDVSGTLTLVLVSPEAPYWPDGSQLNYKNLLHTSATLTWNAAEDNKGIVGYIIYKVDNSQLTVCDSVYSYSVSESVYFSDISSLTPGTAYTFKVEAVDTDGNWTADGPSAAFTTKTDEKPYWQAGKKLEALNIAASSLKLTWSDDAKDDRGIKNYVIYKNGEELKTVAANIRILDVTGLTPGTEYTFKVEAVDTAGQYSDDGPTVQCTTKENFSISTSFRVGSTDEAKVLEANQMLDAAVTVTNYQQTSQQAMLIVALYNNSGAMVNVSYVSRNIAAGDTEYLHAGFKLPSEVEGCTVKAFVWEGTDIASSNMQPISRVEMIPQQ